jgi:AcrR family transcriptional regulator
MYIVVEHEKRQREILEKALDVFIDEGYENATFQKIADRCAIMRTTLYIYFKNIFNLGIYLTQVKSSFNSEKMFASILCSIIDIFGIKSLHFQRILFFILSICMK